MEVSKAVVVGLALFVANIGHSTCILPCGTVQKMMLKKISKRLGIPVTAKTDGDNMCLQYQLQKLQSDLDFQYYNVDLKPVIKELGLKSLHFGDLKDTQKKFFSREVRAPFSATNGNPHDPYIGHGWSSNKLYFLNGEPIEKIELTPSEIQVQPQDDGVSLVIQQYKSEIKSDVVEVYPNDIIWLNREDTTIASGYYDGIDIALRKNDSTGLYGQYLLQNSQKSVFVDPLAEDPVVRPEVEALVKKVKVKNKFEREYACGGDFSFQEIIKKLKDVPKLNLEVNQAPCSKNED